MPIRSVLAFPFLFVRSKVSLIGEWLRCAWRSIDVDDLIEITDYPDRHGELQFRAGVAALNGQYARSAALDTKIAVSGAISLAIAALIPSVLATFGLSLFDLTMKHLVVLPGVLLLLIAFVHSVRGLWPRKYQEMPDLSKIRRLLAEETADDQALWAIAVPIEQAVAKNKEVMESRVATVKIAYLSLCLGLAATIASVLFLVFGMPAPFSETSGFNGCGR